MELIDRIGGFGQVMLTVPEQQMLGEISEIASTAGKSYILGEMNEQTGRYERIMKDLFPMIPLIKSAGVGPLFSNTYYLQILDKSHRYEEFPEGAELQIGSRLFIGETKMVDLRVLIPRKAQQKGYFMSVVVGDHYQLGCIDDIVKVLGERETPTIKGIQMIKNKPTLHPDYGIAEVPQLRTVLKLYEKAAQLLYNVHETIKVYVPELNVLREDALQHKNLALRKLSAVEYHKTLEALTHQ